MVNERDIGAARSGRPGFLFEPTPDAAAAGAEAWYSNRWLLLACRIVLATVFIYAALQKIGRPLLFASEIEMYEVLGPGPLLYLGAIILPWVELFCGFALLTGIMLRGAALILAALNILFIVAVAHRSAAIMDAEGIALRKVYFDCGCGFGPTHAWKKLIENSVLFFCALAILAAPAYRFVLRSKRR